VLVALRLTTPAQTGAQVAIALGSNQGDRAELLRAAVRALPDAGVSVRTLSALYETAPAYVTDQARARGAMKAPSGAVHSQAATHLACVRRSRRF
jgi:hypothetical protein